ncbi:MAG: membrane dipeptidase [Myxococcales bacterium]|nr:membrane dipeptidase [Myxococcales bacterium]
MLACNPGARPRPAASTPQPAPATSPEDQVHQAPRSADEHAALLARAGELARALIIVDGHIDVPFRLEKTRAPGGAITEDVTRATEGGDFDLPRARAGGLNAPFMSIYVPSSYEERGGATEFADRLIDSVESIIARAPDALALARTPAEVREHFQAGKLSLALGMENGAPLAGDLAKLAHFHARGVRYITLTHSRDNHISDSSFDDARTHGGLSEFGRQVVAEMNRLGVIIDVSHVSDEAFWQVLELSRAPVLASHSSCRRFTPGWQRNMSDEMIRALAKAGGVIMINFGSSFISDEYRRRREAEQALLEAEGLDDDSAAGRARLEAWRAERPPVDFASVGQVADHVEHVIALVGVDHVGLGSDFDGLGDSLPTGLKDVSMYPNLLAELLARGHDDDELAKIAGENALRVWDAVLERAAG